MALSHLLKHLYTQSTDDVLRRGRRLHALGYVSLLEHDDTWGNVAFRVKDEGGGSSFHRVAIESYKEPKNLRMRCDCNYNLGDICPHEAAALLRLQETIDKGLHLNGDVRYNQEHTVARMPHIEIRTLRVLASTTVFLEAEEWLKTNKPTIDSAKDDVVKARVAIDGKEYTVRIRRNAEKAFDTYADYPDEHHPLSLPKVIVFLYLFHKHGPHYFETIRNWDVQKNKLLGLYGYSLKDDLKGKFEFQYKDGKPFLRLLDPGIKRVEAPVVIEADAARAVAPVPLVAEEKGPPPEEKELAVVMNLGVKEFPYLSLDVLQGVAEEGAFTSAVEKLDLTKYVDLDYERDQGLLTAVRRTSWTEVAKWLQRTAAAMPGAWEEASEDLPTPKSLTDEQRTLVIEYLTPRLRRLADDWLSKPVYVLPAGKALRTANLQRVEWEEAPADPQFWVERNAKGGYEVQLKVATSALTLPWSENEATTPLFFLHNGAIHLWRHPDAGAVVLPFLPSGKMSVKASAWKDFLPNVLLPLTRQYRVDFHPSLTEDVRGEEPQPSLHVEERGEYLLFRPRFEYRGYTTGRTDGDTLVVPQDDHILRVHRHREKEEAFVEKVRSLHSNFTEQEEGAALALRGTELLKDNWFFLFMDAMAEEKVAVEGMDDLKHFRFNTARPATQIHIASGGDAFDARINVFFGDQRVGVTEIKEALAAKQSYIPLPDGTLGILPEDWLRKYSLLFRVGEGRGAHNLKLSRYHMGVIDQLYDARDTEELTLELEEKYDRIRGADRIREVVAPAAVAEVLRPYQHAGLNWLNYLGEVGWGGILADDMGLGKTVQALSYMLYRYETTGALKALVVCPTTLIYNWEAEIKKFTPALTYIIHHGPQRSRKADALSASHVIITTYGTLRSDIKLFLDIPLEYVVLDESQAIKNPSSKVTKAASLLKAKNRICMSGTPLQNNTFDIWAQMNFLNPGLLGSLESFRNEFAVPIDKFGEKEQKDHLRRLLFPFILRRTKEQVAKELPSKTEMILYCEMGDEQRRVYEAYRMEFRSRILGTIEEQGIQKSQLTILQGLMKLRQICDSPAILNETEKHDNNSIKLEELEREILENIGNHKALVFSQFLGMLALIRQKLDEAGIKYQYFDGSTSAPDRQKAVEAFQGDDETRVFLISLKAGGVGLNLTAADYVYIVDPWWNPAVEQQAIDRTHRIGQTKQIFAYRMICKDTIEDKIILLQERKRALAKDLVTDDDSFVKTLTKEDVEYLFG